MQRYWQPCLDDKQEPRQSGAKWGTLSAILLIETACALVSGRRGFGCSLVGIVSALFFGFVFIGSFLLQFLLFDVQSSR
jgi:hypothetical protein